MSSKIYPFFGHALSEKHHDSKQYWKMSQGSLQQKEKKEKKLPWLIPRYNLVSWYFSDEKWPIKGVLFRTHNVKLILYIYIYICIYI